MTSLHDDDIETRGRAEFEGPRGASVPSDADDQDDVDPDTDDADSDSADVDTDSTDPS